MTIFDNFEKWWLKEGQYIGTCPLLPEETRNAIKAYVADLAKVIEADVEEEVDSTIEDQAEEVDEALAEQKDAVLEALQDQSDLIVDAIRRADADDACDEFLDLINSAIAKALKCGTH